MDYNMNEIDVPKFKRGKGKIGDWIKKHKKELGLTAGALASLGALAGAIALGHKSSEAHRGYRAGFPERPFNPLKVAESEADVEQYKRDIETEIRALRHQGRRESKHNPSSPPPPPRTPSLPPRRLSDDEPPPLISATPPSRHRYITSIHEEKRDYPARNLLFEPKVGYRGRGLKDSGFVKFLKKHKTKLGISAGLLSALGIGALGAYNYKKNDPSRQREEEKEETPQEIERRLDSYYNDPLPESDLYGGKKCKCKCGSCASKIMKNFGAEHLAEMMLQNPKIGRGIISDLHSGITKGFNLVGKTGLNVLVELAVALLGPLSRPFVNKLIFKYGMKGLSFIKKYAHKGLTWIKDNVMNELKGEEIKKPKKTIKGRGACCDKCKPFYENEFMKGNIKAKDIEKIGGNFINDLGSSLIYLGKKVIAPTLRIVPGSLGEALAYAPEHLGEIASITSPGFKPEDPFAEDKFNKPSYYGAHVTPTAQPKPFKDMRTPKKDITAKPFTGGSFFDKLMALFPHRLINSIAHEKMKESMTKKSDKKGGKKITSKQIYKLIPWALLEELFGEVLDIPRVSILPRRMRDLSGGLPNPFTNPLNRLHDVPKPKPRPKPVEGDAHILPYPFNPLDGGRKIITPDHPQYNNLFNPNQPTQNPNFNESYVAPVKNINEEDSKFKFPKAGAGKKKKKITKKTLKSILKF